MNTNTSIDMNINTSIDMNAGLSQGFLQPCDRESRAGEANEYLKWLILRRVHMRMDSIQLRAMGKINLGLDVVRRRPAGYHEVKMVMQTVNLFDRIGITVQPSPGIHITSNLPYLPTNENNIVYKRHSCSYRPAVSSRAYPCHWRSIFP